MKNLLIFVALLLLITFYCDAETLSKKAGSRFLPGICFHEGRRLETGEHQILGKCKRVTCSAKGWISEHSCIENKHANRKGCYPGEKVDINEPFPECCKREYKCLDDKGLQYTIRDY